MKYLFFVLGAILGSLIMPLLLQWLVNIWTTIVGSPIVMRSADGWKPATDCDPVDVAPAIKHYNDQSSHLA